MEHAPARVYRNRRYRISIVSILQRPLQSAKLITNSCPTPAWLPNGHIQTIYAAKCIKAKQPRFKRQRLNTPDLDFLDLDWLHPSKSLAPSNYGLIILHGLEGNSQSHYAVAMANFFRKLGWTIVVAHFRGCSGSPNKLPRAYHSGDSRDVCFIVDQVITAQPDLIWHVAGVSLGGNALLHYLGTGQNIPVDIKACAAICAPTNLYACGMHLSNSISGKFIYTRHFLATMMPKLIDKAYRFPNDICIDKIKSIKTLYDFDDIYTAPIHGFENAIDYWTKASSGQFLKYINVPTLILNSYNDPFIPAKSLPAPELCSDAITLQRSKSGGHVGFVSGPFPGHLDWLPQQLYNYFQSLA